MSRIPELVEDARFLAQGGRYFGALSLLLIAVGASSRRFLPQGTPSLKPPKKAKPVAAMGDGEAYTLFLGGRIARMMSAGGIDKPGPSPISIGVAGKPMDLAVILYKLYRSAIVHEGELAPQVRFAENVSAGLGIDTGNNTLTLNLGLLDLLVNVVEGADCNADLYGREVFDTRAKPSVDVEKLKADVISEFSISPGRYDLFPVVLYFLDPARVSDATDVELRGLFLDIIPKLGGGAITGLSSAELTDDAGNLQPKGIAVLRRVATNYERVRVR